ncbi:MAG: transmembrane ion channel [Ignavibacteriae bacterium HGW-Ignavibacteriae-4]|nr:MAG: transmembrane ion channel [Ignavibacteriae bacterium HGW-Ignavibacteriae-4]
MNHINRILTVFFVFLFPLILFSQTDTVVIKKDSLEIQDSLNTQLLKEYQLKIVESQQQKIQDSIRRAELETKINQLKTTDNLKKEELQQQLADLNQKENKRLEQKKARIDALRGNAKSFPVYGLFNDTLFTIFSKYGSFTASERAAATTERIKKLSESAFVKLDLQVIESETTFDIVSGEITIISLSENDALWENKSNKALAYEYKEIIAAEIIRYKKETSVSELLKEIGSAALVIFILVLLLVYVNKLFNWTGNKIIDQDGLRISDIKIKNYTLFDSNKIVSIMASLNKLVKVFIFLFLIYISLPIIFGFFPWTQGFAQTLFGYILNPLMKMLNSIWNYLPSLFTILVIFIVFRYIIKFVGFLKTEIEQGNLKLNGFYPDWASPTFQIVRVVLYAFMFVLIFPFLPGSDSPVFQGVSVFLGFLFTFGSAGSLSNIIAGIVLTYMRLFRIGDRVKIGDVVGDVVEKSLLVTRVKTIKNEIISIPNATVMSNHTTNYSFEAETGNGLILHSTVTIGYDVPWKEIHNALINAAKRTELLLNNPEPFVLQTSLEDFYVSYQINAYTREYAKQATIYSDLHQNIQDCCNEVGIEILSPHYRAARDGNMVTIPTQYLKKDYKPPTFNIRTYKDDENQKPT